MNEAKLKELIASLDEATKAYNEKLAQAQKDLEGGNTEDAAKANDELKVAEKDINERSAQITALQELVTRDAKKGGVQMPGKAKKVSTESRDAFNAFIHTRGKEKDGLTTTDVGVLIPEDISFTPQKEVKTIVDLSAMVNKQQVKTGSGKYPVLAFATTGMVSVAELAKNPELAHPKFSEIDWSVETYRGFIPLSQEAVDDSAVDLTSLVSENMQEQALITKNTAISTEIKGFTAKEVTDTDGIKDIFNVAIDPAYAVGVIASQSFFNTVDKLKDKNGQYILQNDITAQSGKSLFGRPVVVIADELLGKAGEANAFIGDIKRALFMANRVDTSAKWVDDNIYGQLLAIFMRFDVKKADEKAGFFVTWKDTSVAP